MSVPVLLQQEHIVIEGTCRARGINHLGTVYTRFPPNFDINNLAPLEVPRETVADGAAKKEEQATSAAVEQKPAEDILTDTTEAEEDKGAPKSAIQLDFEKAAGVCKKGYVARTSTAASGVACTAAVVVVGAVTANSGFYVVLL